ncbi:MAG: helix-turn-helix domain-containing protein [Oscillospiraceae bacterium]|nr:helix-turn-helix domain-containing protein [Oscillospiraceae bacterium]
MSLGTNIQQLRKSASLSQEQLADKLSVSRQAISKWETDQTLPEIDKILALSRFFSVSTDSLLDNLSIMDNSTYTNIPIDKKLTRFTKELIEQLNLKSRKVLFMLFSLLCFIAIGVSFIVNLAVEGTISWAMYPLYSVAVGWLIFIPVFFSRYILSLILLTISTIPFLYLLDGITPGKSWFFTLAIPSAIVGAVLIWITYLVIVHLKIDLFYRLAISPCITSLIANLVIDHYVNIYCGTTTSLLQLIINLFSNLAAVLVLAFIGYTRSNKRNSKRSL